MRSVWLGGLAKAIAGGWSGTTAMFQPPRVRPSCSTAICLPAVMVAVPLKSLSSSFEKSLAAASTFKRGGLRPPCTCASSVLPIGT